MASELETERPQLELITIEEIDPEEWRALMVGVISSMMQEAAKVEAQAGELKAEAVGIQEAMRQFDALMDLGYVINCFRTSDGKLFYNSKKKKPMGFNRE